MALVTLPGSINPLKIVTTAKVRLHKGRLVVSRRETLSPLGTPALQHQPAILASHPGAKAMGLGSTPVVWLKSGLRHRWISSCAKTVRLTATVASVKKATLIVAHFGSLGAIREIKRPTALIGSLH